MRYLIRRQWLVVCFTFLSFLSSILSYAFPHNGRMSQQTATQTVKHNFLVRRNDDPFLGEDWEIAAMDNLVAYQPHAEAAAALEDFYTSLQILAQYPISPADHWLIHQIGRVVISFQCPGMPLSWALIFRFANGMLEFTRRGYTGSYRMQFRHTTFGFTITVILSILPPSAGNGNERCVVEEHGQVNHSGIQQHQVCVRLPLDPGRRGSGHST